MHCRSGSDDEATANSVMTELLDLLASAVPKDTAAGKCKATHLFFGDVVRLFPFPKTSPVSSSKKLISIQRCRRLWGSFGLASYSTLNAIYWIMNLLCSSDRVNSVNSLSIHPKKNRPLRSLSDPGWNSNEFLSPRQSHSTGSQLPRRCLVKILAESWGLPVPVTRSTVLHGYVWTCYLIWRAKKNMNKNSSCWYIIHVL